MAQSTIIPLLNPFAFRPVDPARPTRYKRGHLDDSWQSELVLSFQTQAYYEQKVERGNRFRFQFKATPNTAHSLKVLDCKGKTVLTINQTATVSVTGDKTADGTQYETYYYKLADLSGIPDDGTYYLLVTVNYDGSNIKQWISEPISLKDTHENTLLIEYTHSENKGDILFEQLPVRYPFLIESYIDGMEPASADTVYEDQNYNLDQLDSTPYRGWTLYVGPTGDGVPDWAIDKLNRILSCDSVLFDGKQYRKGDGAKLTPKRNQVYPLSSAEVAIREAFNDEGATFGNQIAPLYTSPGFPYALSTLQVGPYEVATATVIADNTAEVAFIAALNAAAGDFELYGTFSKVSGVIRYENAPGENYTGYANIYTNKFSATLTTPGSFPPYLFTFDTALADMVVKWGDGNVSNISSTVQQTHLHTYPGAPATYTIEFWGKADAFILSNFNISGITGAVPAGMTRLELSVQSFPSNTFNASFVAPAALTLHTLKVTYSGLTAVNGFYGSAFKRLKTWDFSGNALTGTILGLLLTDIHQNSSINSIYSGAAAMVAQSPAATLSGAGIYYRDILRNVYTWTINH